LFSYLAFAKQPPKTLKKGFKIAIMHIFQKGTRQNYIWKGWVLVRKKPFSLGIYDLPKSQIITCKGDWNKAGKNERAQYKNTGLFGAICLIIRQES